MVLLSVVVVAVAEEGLTWVAVSLLLLIGAVAQVEMVLLSVVGVGAVLLLVVVAAVAEEETLTLVVVSLLVLVGAVAQEEVLLLAVGEEVSLSLMQESYSRRLRLGHFAVSIALGPAANRRQAGSLGFTTTITPTT